jgi:hypothetical protein
MIKDGDYIKLSGSYHNVIMMLALLTDTELVDDDFIQLWYEAWLRRN